MARPVHRLYPVVGSWPQDTPTTTAPVHHHVHQPCCRTGPSGASRRRRGRHVSRRQGQSAAITDAGASTARWGLRLDMVGLDTHRMHAAVAGRGALSPQLGQVGPWRVLPRPCPVLLLYCSSSGQSQWDSDNSDGDSDNYEAYPF